MLSVPRVSVLGFAALMLASAPAVAGHGGGHGGGMHGGGMHGGGMHGGFHHGGGFHHFHHGFTTFGGFGFGPYFGYPYYYPYYYGYPYPYGYAPDAYVVPSPLYSVPSPGQCRTFNGDALIAGTNQPFYGTACWQSDGAWHITP